MPLTPLHLRLCQSLPYLAQIPADPTLKSHTISWLTVTVPCLTEKHKTVMIRSEIESNKLMKQCRLIAQNTNIYCKRSTSIYKVYVWTHTWFQYETRSVLLFILYLHLSPYFYSLSTLLPTTWHVIRQYNQHAICIHLLYFIDCSSFVKIQGI